MKGKKEGREKERIGLRFTCDPDPPRDMGNREGKDQAVTY
jgi:hypothetical protein